MDSRNPVNGSTYLVLGILSLVLCFCLGPVAWSMSENALSTLDVYEAETGDISQRGLVNAGRICGIIATIILALTICAVVFRGCAQSEERARRTYGYGSTMTIDGRPATPEERRMFESQTRPPGR